MGKRVKEGGFLYVIMKFCFPNSLVDHCLDIISLKFGARHTISSDEHEWHLCLTRVSLRVSSCSLDITLACSHFLKIKLLGYHHHHWTFGKGLYGMPGIMKNALQFIWFWPISCVNPILRGSHLLPSQLPREPTGVLPHMVHSTFKPFTIMTSLSYTGRVRNPVVGHESIGPQVVFSVHQSHRCDSTHPGLVLTLNGSNSQLCLAYIEISCLYDVIDDLI